MTAKKWNYLTMMTAGIHNVISSAAFNMENLRKIFWECQMLLNFLFCLVSDCV